MAVSREAVAAGPEAFIRQIYPAAAAAAKASGLDIRVVLAQAAAETGWGKSVLKGTNNLLNIQQGVGWGGPTRVFPVTEFLNGAARLVPRAFRVYKNVADSIHDWASFLKSNPRYSKAGLFRPEIKGDPLAQVAALAAAGYATDPKYRELVGGIATGSRLSGYLEKIRSERLAVSSRVRQTAPVVKAASRGFVTGLERDARAVGTRAMALARAGAQTADGILTKAVGFLSPISMDTDKVDAEMDQLVGQLNAARQSKARNAIARTPVQAKMIRQPPTKATAPKQAKIIQPTPLPVQRERVPLVRGKVQTEPSSPRGAGVSVPTKATRWSDLPELPAAAQGATLVRFGNGWFYHSQGKSYVRKTNETEWRLIGAARQPATVLE